MTSLSSSPVPPPATEPSALVNAVRVLRERWWLIAVSFVVCAGISLALSLHATKQYTATAKLLIRPSNLPALIDQSQTQAQDSTTLARQQSDDAALVSSSAVAQRVKQALNSRESVADLQLEVVATPDANNDLMDVSVTDPDPVRAARLANGFANALVAYLNEAAQAQLVAGRARLQSELAKLPPTDPGRTALQQGLRQVIALEAVTNGGVQVVEAATPPSSPSSPNVKRDVILGGVVGIVIGLVLAFLLDLFDRRIKDSEDLERLYGLPALSLVPMRKRSLAADFSAQTDLEPFRILRDGLAYISLRKDTRVILITSAVPGEGKTYVASGLARAMAAADKTVALVEADVHRPAVRGQFGLQLNGRGLTNALVDGTNPLELVHADPKLTGISVLPSGAFTPNSAGLLGSPAMAEVLERLLSGFDYVVLDGPPLLPVADARVLLDNPTIDVALVVARPYLITREQVRTAVPVLKRHTEKGIGLVINAVRDSPSGYYHPGTSANGATAKRGLGRLIGSGRG